MIVCGNNDDYRLGGSVNSTTNEPEDIKNPCKSKLEISTLLSFWSYYISVWINKKGEAFAVGDNESGNISSTLPNEKLDKDTKINLQFKNGQPCKFISAVGGVKYTLYQVSNETSNPISQLAYAHKGEKTIFLNIGKRSPLSLYGGYEAAAVIDTEGAIIIITESVYKSPTSEIKALNLPSGDKAVKLACCKNSILALGQSCKVYECPLEGSYKFTEVSELSSLKINDISGTSEHFFAVCEDGCVFGRGSNGNEKLGMPKSISSIDKFEIIKSLSKHRIIEAFAGLNHSLFKTSEGKILGVGDNYFHELMINTTNSIINPPKEIHAAKNATFCIAGSWTSIAFVGVDPPPNTPNRKVTKFSIPSPTKVTKPPQDTSSETRRMKDLIDENLSLKKELDESKKRIRELEDENKKLKATPSSNTEGLKTGNQLDILDQETLDNLKRIKSLGRGATSEVFEVVREEHLALKVYFPEIVKDDDDEEEEEKIVINFKNAKRLLLEYESLNQLNHANIIKTLGINFGDSTHPPAILLEYCPSNLKKKIKKLTNSERICAIVDLSKAMKEVHSVGIIHRDLKLENILVDENNKIKVSDFGLCTLIELDSETMSRTQMTGTLKYMAPELLQEKTDYDEKVDVYSFGVVVYQILMKGEFPKIGIADVILGKKATLPNSISEFSRDIINKCWSYKASDRPSFSEICSTLEGNENKLI